MKRRNFVGLTAAAAASGALFGACGKVGFSRNSRALVATAEKRKAYLDNLLRKLCIEIGPHPVFDADKYGKAVDVVKAEMDKALPFVSLDECSFKGWKLLSPATLTVGGKPLEVRACHGSPSTPGSGVSGAVKRVEFKNPDKVLYAVADPATGEAKAYIVTNQYAPAIPLPIYSNPAEGPINVGHATFDKQGKWPLFCVGSVDVPVLEAAAKARTTAECSVRTAYVPGMHANSVVGTLPGENKDEVLILAHLDTVYGSPGANDNTASMIVMLMLAHAFSGTIPVKTVTFMATAGEEYGKLGAQHFLEQRQGTDTLKIIKSCIEFDSLTWGNNLQLYSTDERLLRAADEANTAAKIDGTPKIFNEFSGGDCKPFYDANVPVLYVNSRGDKYKPTLNVYHTPDDTPAHVAPELVENSFLVFRQMLGQMIA